MIRQRFAEGGPSGLSEEEFLAVTLDVAQLPGYCNHALFRRVLNYQPPQASVKSPLDEQKVQDS